MVEQAEIRVVHQGGSNITFREPAISSDSRFLLCASGHNVKVFSTVTEECVQELRGHTDLVTGVLLRPSNHLQLLFLFPVSDVRHRVSHLLHLRLGQP
uniref:Uncharacterized protein n=1 Tax=Poecilia reticulata TaxID=8081 RepID=A0A3P9NH48_POERE